MNWFAALLLWIASLLPVGVTVPNEMSAPQVIPYEVWAAALDTFGTAEVDLALCIARWESQFRSDSVGAEGEVGVWQIHPIHGIPADALRNVRVNAAAAKSIRDRGGWSHWTTSRRCM